jgi:hypothetical protein
VSISNPEPRGPPAPGATEVEVGSRAFCFNCQTAVSVVAPERGVRPRSRGRSRPSFEGA